MGQISTKYFFQLYHQKIFAVSLKGYIQLVLKISFISFLQPAQIETDSIVKSPPAKKVLFASLGFYLPVAGILFTLTQDFYFLLGETFTPCRVSAMFY